MDIRKRVNITEMIILTAPSTFAVFHRLQVTSRAEMVARLVGGEQYTESLLYLAVHTVALLGIFFKKIVEDGASAVVQGGGRNNVCSM